MAGAASMPASIWTDAERAEPLRLGGRIRSLRPARVPVKRTALGRFKHECCTHAVCPDGRVAFYSGDDERFDYLYKFVTAKPWNPNDKAANRDLLDEGTLYVAQFEANGSMRWLPLVHGQGPLTAANGFATQGDVVIEARRAADLLGATPMDRPEDVETNPVNGRVYVMLTNNSSRKRGAGEPGQSPRRATSTAMWSRSSRPAPAPPRWTTPPTEARWGIFLAAGKPGIDAGAQYHRATSDQGWLSCPDNCAFDSKGRIWIATDGSHSTPASPTGSMPPTPPGPAGR